MINIPCNGKQMCLKTALLSTLSPGDVVGIPTGHLMTLNLHGPKVPENFVRTLTWAPESIYFRRSWKCWLLLFLPNNNVKLWNMEIIPRIVVFSPLPRFFKLCLLSVRTDKTSTPNDSSFSAWNSNFLLP